MEEFNFTKINTPPWVFFKFLKLYKWYQIAQRNTYVDNVCSYYMREAFEYVSQVRLSSWNNYTRLKFLFEKLPKGRKVFHILVPQYGANYRI